MLVQEWAARPERGALPLIKLGVWIALRLGRRAARLFLYPDLPLFPGLVARRRARVRAPIWRGRWGAGRVLPIFLSHFLTFASCLLDRVFLLNEQSREFDI